MKKIDIVQTTVLVIAVINAYSAVDYFLSLLPALAMAFNPISGGVADIMIRLIITIAMVVAVYLLIRYSRQIAVWLLKSDPESDEEDVARWNVDRRTLIFALIVGIGLYMLVFALSYAINDLYALFKYKAATGYSTRTPPKTNYLVLELLRVTIGAFLIYASPNLTDFIEKNIAIRLKVATPEALAPDTPPDTMDADPDTQSS